MAPAPVLMTVEDYFTKTPETVKPVELVYGLLRAADSPSPRHQQIVLRLALALSAHVQQLKLGQIWVAPLDVVLDHQRALIVQPDLFFVSNERAAIVKDRVFVGANDGGSSTGLLLELARVIGQHPDLARKIELVFFDGEEAFEEFSQKDGLYGSRYFARQLKTARQFRGGLLFDMVGDRSLGITLPSDSPAEMARDIFAAAEALKLRNYFSYFDRELIDDHAPLNAIGIPTLDIIDFDYPPWHTAGDTLDKISAESLQIVGSVAMYYLSEFALKR